MNAHDGTRNLIDVLERQHACLSRLHEVMAAQRTLFLAVRPSELSERTARVQELATAATQLDGEREQVLGELSATLGLRGRPKISSLARAVPVELRSQLTAVADRVRAVSEKLQVEARTGARLLELSAESQASMFRELLGVGQSQHRGYDRNARAVGASAESGRLLSGNV